jgi:hypothetical protein
MPGARQSTQLLPDPRINVYDRAELRHWAHELRVSEKQLLSAIKKAGTGLEAVKNELRRKISLGAVARH